MKVTSNPKPVVQVLTMGGTIAGVAQSAVSASYQAGARPGTELLASVPGIADRAQLDVQDVVAKDSSDLVLSDWSALLACVNRAIHNEKVDAIVITHGTDTMEETAFFLSLLASTEKPIILVGAMRPATSLSADGPLNLYNAISVAIHPDSKTRGVQIVMNDRIMPARLVTKGHTTAVESFAMPSHGGFGAGVGTVTFGTVKYLEPAAPQRLPEDISLSWPMESSPPVLPRVDILYQHVGMHVPDVAQLLESKENRMQGLVLAGTGAGNVACYLKPFLEALQARGVIIVRTTRVWAGGVVADYQQLDTEWGLVGAGGLNPQKARILLMLLLQQTQGLSLIRQYFAHF